MLESNEFDLESIAKSYSIQGIALEQSEKQRNDQYLKYAATMEEYKKVKKDTLTTHEQWQILYSNFYEKLKIKNSFNQLQNTPNLKLDTSQKNILDIHEKMSKDSDEFVSSVNTIIDKIQNLPSDFHEPAILKNKSECSQKIKHLVDAFVAGSDKFAIRMRCHKKHPYAYEIRNTKIAIHRSLKNIDLRKIKLELSENENHLALLNKNIDFLKKGNAESKVQLKKF